MSSPSPIPVVIITGHIGSGKTTFINELALNYEGTVSYLCHRFLQEFGTTNCLSDSLEEKIKQSNGSYSAIFDFGSGCVCCSPKGDFQRSLSEMTSNKTVKPDLILVETTGLADPSVFISAMEEEGETLGVALKGVILVIDPRNSQALLSEPTPINLNNHLQQQLKYANTIVVRKDMLEGGRDGGSLSSEQFESAIKDIMNRKHVSSKLLTMSSGKDQTWKSLDVLLPEPAAVPNLLNLVPGTGAGLDAASSTGSIKFGGLSGGISSGILAPSLTAHDKRYSSSCMMAEGVGLSESALPAFFEWIKELINEEGMMRLKGIIYIRRQVKQGSEESKAKRDKLYSHKLNPIRAVGLLDVTKQDGISWHVVEMPPPTQASHHDHLNDHSTDSHTLDTPEDNKQNMHCADMSCPLNSVVSMSGTYSGDFYLSEALKKRDELEANLLCSQQSNEDDNLLFQTISGLESKIFIIGKKLPFDNMTSSLRSFLVPDGFVEVGDEEIDFNAKTTELAVNIKDIIPSKCAQLRSKLKLQTEMEQDSVFEVSIRKCVKQNRFGSDTVVYQASSSSANLEAQEGEFKQQTNHQVLRLFDGALYVGRQPIE